MYKIICSYCGEQLAFQTLSERPETCPNCFSPLERADAQETTDPQETEIEYDEALEEEEFVELTLTYQKTNEQIHLNSRDKIVLGRESGGAEVLGKIPQVSRRHCVIEFIDNQYRITDLDSFNGTYLGISKVDCKVNPQQILNDSDILFLGKEPFLVKKCSEEKAVQEKKTGRVDEKMISSDAELVKKRIVSYKCLGCGKEYDQKRDICEECGTYNQWEEIERESLQD